MWLPLSLFIRSTMDDDDDDDAKNTLARYFGIRFGRSSGEEGGKY